MLMMPPETGNSKLLWLVPKLKPLQVLVLLGGQIIKLTQKKQLGLLPQAMPMQLKLLML